MKKEFGKWLMDIAKYIITAVILTSYFQGVDEKQAVYTGGGLVALMMLAVGLYLQKDLSIKKKRRK